MEPERWQQIERVWDEALDVPRAEREAFLDRACLGDEELRQEVVSLLAAHDETEDFIEAPALEHAAELLADTSVHSMVGRSLGHYQITSFLGAGGMGEVYLARDIQLSRPVALKILPAEFAGTESSLRRFELEARAVSSLNHPNIITIHEVGESEGCHFIATEYVEGATLRRHMSGGVREINEALDIVMQIAAALAAAHGAGVVHSDVKPENVMMRADGYLKVLDFGIAKFTKSLPGGRKEDDETCAALSSTNQGSVIGTLPYMSPEQARGEDVDARTDVWSAGVIFYELVTGALPFTGSNTAETLTAILEKDFPPLPTPALPEQLGRVMTKALQKNRDERYQTAKELLGDLRELKQQLDFQAALSHASDYSPAVGRPPQTPIERVTTETPPRSRGADFILNHYRWLGVAFALLLAAFSLTIYQRNAGSGNIQTDSQSSSLRPAPLTSYSGTEGSPAISPDGNYVAFSWDGEREDNFDIYVQPVGASSDSTPLRLTTDPGEDTVPAWSPDGREIAFSRGRKLFLVAAAGGGERQIGETSGGPISFFPDGKSLAIASRQSAAHPQSIHQLDIETGEKRRLTTPPADSFGDFNPVFSPDGRTMGFCRYLSSAVNDIYLMSVDGDGGSSGEPRRLTTDERLIYGFTWTEDGEAILFSSNRENNRGLWRIPVSGGTAEHVPVPADNPLWPSTSRRGSRLAYEQKASDINIWRLEKPVAAGAAVPPTKLIFSSQDDFSPQYSPDDKRIVFRSKRSGNDEIWRCEADGTRPVRLTKMEGPLTGSPKWSPDGRWIVFDSRPDGQADLFVIGVEGEGLRRLTETNTAEVVPSWSQDGRLIYFASNRGGDFQIYQMPAEGGAAQQVTKHGGFAPVASADGRYIFYAKGRDASGVWSVPVEGGEEAPVTESPKAWFWGYWAVTERGIYFVETDEQNPIAGAGLNYYDFSDRNTSRIAVLDKPPVRGDSGLAASFDGSSFLYTQADHSGSDIILVENYR